MKTKIFYSIRPALYIWPALLITSGVAAQENECWEYKAQTKTYFTKARDNEISVEEKTFGPFKTQQECQASAEKNKGTKTYQSWILLKREVLPGNCTRCSKGGVKIQPKGPAAGDQNNRDLQNDYLDAVMTDRMMKWYTDIISPIDGKNIVKLLGTYKQWVPVGTLGTALGAYSIARAYVKMFEGASELSLQRAMDLINVSREERQQFLTASGAYMMSARVPVKYYSGEDAKTVISAFTLSAALASRNETEGSALAKSALLAVAGFVASESGDKQTAKTLLASAMITLNNCPDSPQRSNLSGLMQRTNDGYSLGMDMNPIGSRLSQPVIQTPAYPDISGEYECIDCPSAEVPNATLTQSYLKVSVNNGYVTLRQTYHYDYQAYHMSNGYLTVDRSAHTQDSEFNASGKMEGSQAIISGNSVTATSSSTTYISIEGKTINNPARTDRMPVSGRLTTIQGGGIRLYSEAKGYSGTNNYRKVR